MLSIIRPKDESYERERKRDIGEYVLFYRYVVRYREVLVGREEERVDHDVCPEDQRVNPDSQKESSAELPFLVWFQYVQGYQVSFLSLSLDWANPCAAFVERDAEDL